MDEPQNPPHTSWEARMEQRKTSAKIDYAQLPDMTPAQAQTILAHCLVHAGDYRDPLNPHALTYQTVLDVMDKETPRLAGMLEVIAEHAARPSDGVMPEADRHVLAEAKTRMKLYAETDHEALSMALALKDALAEVMPRNGRSR